MSDLHALPQLLNLLSRVELDLLSGNILPAVGRVLRHGVVTRDRETRDQFFLIMLSYSCWIFAHNICLLFVAFQNSEMVSCCTYERVIPSQVFSTPATLTVQED